MSVTKKLHYRLSISFLLFSMVFSALAPTMSLAREIENSEPVSSRELTAEPAEVLSLPMPEEVKPAPLLVEESLAEVPIDSESMPEVPVETLAVTTDDPEPYIQRDEIKSLTDKLNIDTDANSGAFVYSYPIEVPAGRNGLQPYLQLTYNSQNNDNQNLFGYGWTINIPYIERLNKTGIDKLYTDNYFSSSLTGELVAIDANGNYGSKVENGEFFDYQYDDVNNNWTARDKQGTVYTFGATVSSRQDNPNDTTKVFKWMLEEVRDTNDNFIRYEYYKDAGQIYPYKVFYTGYGNTDGIYEVEFLRELRSDNLASFATGFSVDNNYRINEIQISVSNQWEKKYHLNYVVGDNNARSLLDNIVEGARDPNSGVMMTMPENGFNYVEVNSNWTENISLYPPIFFTEERYNLGDRIADVNGDGLMDILRSEEFMEGDPVKKVWINNGSAWVEDVFWQIPIYFKDRYQHADVRLADVNGDGLIDILESWAFGYPAGKKVYINNGSAWVEDTSWQIPIYFKEELRGNLTSMGVKLEDINSDGLVDILQSFYDNEYDTYIKKVYINNGSTWLEDSSWQIPVYFEDNYVGDQGVELADVNGDGLLDILQGYIYNTTYIKKVYINNGSTWVEDASWQLPVYLMQNDRTWGVKLADVNGDGLVDILRSHDSIKKVWLNNGSTWVEDSSWQIPTLFREGIDEQLGIRLEDVNSDGLVDILQSTSLSGGSYLKKVWLNNGSTWVEEISWKLPVNFLRSDNSDNGVKLSDINGDGLVDILQSRETINKVWLNNGVSWTYDNSWQIPTYFIYPNVNGQDVKLVDVNGDGLTDIVRSSNHNGDAYKMVWINNGSAWLEDSSWDIPVYFSGSSGLPNGVNLADVNGDGLVDILESWFIDSSNFGNKVWINNGSTWLEDSSWEIPISFQAANSMDNGVRLADVNGDGLVDILQSNEPQNRHVWINNGGGWIEDSSWQIQINFAFAGYDQGVRLADANGDGLIDILESLELPDGDYNKSIWINNGGGWIEDSSWQIPVYFKGRFNHDDVILMDVNGDDIMDILQSYDDTRKAWGNNSDHEFLQQTISDSGAEINIDYQSSAQATTTDNNLENPNLPFIVQTVKQITIDDGLGNESTIDYKYSDGQYYYNNPYDKKFAGFGQIEKIIDNTKTITYYHQGNESNSSQGEYNDSYYKIGKAYRQETYDNNTDELLNQSIYKWEEYDQGDGNKFVYNIQKADTNFVGTSKSAVSQYLYDTSNGNLLTENNLGEVLVNTDTGEVTNQITGDEKDTDYDYAQNTAEHILAAPKTKVISDTTDSKQQDLYYDNLPLGQIDKVNLTKEDYIEQDVEVNRKFNSYGLVYEQSDPNFATTTIAYDSNNLYPISSTDPLNNITYTEYNLLNRQIATSTAPNGLVTVNKFDAFGRLTEVWYSNPDSPSTLIKKQEINYQDTTLPRYKETKDYFDINSYTTSREYYDGLDRVIQTKMQTAIANEYATVDISYDSQGRMNRQSLPYITSSISYSAPNLSKPAKTYTYDALGRVLTETTPVGTTSYDYNGFTTKITDANGNFKELTKDAYGNLVEVKEYNDTEIYTTTYQYTLTNKLKKITDSAGNIRNFSYDALDNLEWQDMVHKPSVTTPAKINYSHDKNGNVLTETSFKGDNISYVYDDLNRVLFEKLAGANQITYTYDQNNDIGQLSLADYSNNNRKAYDYDILGNLKTSTTTIEGEDFVMNFDYDLNGNVKSIVYPNNWLVSYGFNNIGQVNSVSLDKGTGPIVLTDNIEYNQNGQMTHVERANGVMTDYTYDSSANFRLTNLASTVATSTLQDISYIYDAVGNITQITDNSSTNLAKTAWYDYDDLYRLASSTVNYLTQPADNYSKTYNYDAIGNMTYNSDLGLMNYANGQPHQLSSFAGRTFTYDGAGNTKTNNINKFSWDWRNRLKSSYDIASENSTYYQYDHNNQRFIKYIEELVFIPPDIEETRPSIYQSENLISKPVTLGGEELDATGGGTYELQRVKEHKYIDSYFEKDIADNTKNHINLNSTKIATVNNNDNPYFILGDHLGSSSLLTDSTGTVAEMTDYLPYGKINYESTTQDLGDDYKHTGKELDEENALQYFGARYMDNEVGRFTAIDPLVLRAVVSVLDDPQALNSYAYALNNPARYVDPSGNNAEEFGWGSLKGAWKGLKETGQAIAAAVQNPSLIVTSVYDLAKETYSDAAYLAESYANDPEGTRQQIEASFAWLSESWNNLSDEQKGEMTGYALEKGLEAYLASKGVTKSLSSGSTLKNTLQPNGKLVGTAGSNSSIRIMSGTASDAQAFFDSLTKGGRVVENLSYQGTLVEVEGGYVGIRSVQTKSPNTISTIDVNIKDIPIKKIKFNE